MATTRNQGTSKYNSMPQNMNDLINKIQKIKHNKDMTKKEKTELERQMSKVHKILEIMAK